MTIPSTSKTRLQRSIMVLMQVIHSREIFVDSTYLVTSLECVSLLRMSKRGLLRKESEGIVFLAKTH